MSRSLRKDPALWIVAILVLVAFFVTHALEGREDFSLRSIFPALETAVSVTAIAIAIFVKWGWRWKLFRGWLVVVDDISGCWVGFIHPVSTTHPEPVAAVANIRQSLSRVSVVVWTSKLQSTSFAAEIYCDEDSGEQQLTYSYRANPFLSNKDTNPTHDGTAMLVALADAQRLSGKYWTDRLTRGDIDLQKRSAKPAPDPRVLLEQPPEEQ